MEISASNSLSPLTDQLSAQQRAQVEEQVRAFNDGLGVSGEVEAGLGRDDFLQLLITQLQNQDPTSPMNDREFIAQMAQFSTLEQMSNLSGDFTALANVLSSGQAMGLIGRSVEVATPAGPVSGQVTEVTGGEFPQVMVNDRYYSYDAVQRVWQD